MVMAMVSTNPGSSWCEHTISSNGPQIILVCAAPTSRKKQSFIYLRSYHMSHPMTWFTKGSA
uniref:Uncharacterized protein n=1 Tax=Arundo donax TaxID=35708 RepID=A0A0A9FG87_ARUDO